MFELKAPDESSKANELITVEETCHLGNELEKHSQNPYKALQILKLLERKAITPKILAETKIGKKLKPVIE